MRGPRPPEVVLTTELRRGLEMLVRRHATPQKVALRGRIVLAAVDGLNNSQIARSLAVDVDTIRLWRDRRLGFGAASVEDLGVEERLTDAPRPGAPARIGPEQVCAVLAPACEAPQKSGRPITMER